MPAVMDEGICIRHWDWSETSQTLSVFTREHGVLRALAKGSRRPKAAFGGGIELLTRGRLGVIVRPSSELALLTEWDLVETFPRLRTELRHHHAGLYIADLIHHMVIDRDPHMGLYDDAVAALRQIDKGPTELALLQIQYAALVQCGYRPRLEPVGDGGDNAIGVFSPTLGAMVAPDAPGAGATWKVRRETIRVLTTLAAGGSLDGSGEKDLDRANRFLASYIRYVLGTEMPTVRFLFTDLKGGPGGR